MLHSFGLVETSAHRPSTNIVTQVGQTCGGNASARLYIKRGSSRRRCRPRRVEHRNAGDEGAAARGLSSAISAAAPAAASRRCGRPSRRYPPSQVVNNLPAKRVRHENRLRHRTPIDCRARRAYILVGHSEADYLLHAFDWGFSVRAGRPHTILKNRMRGALYGALQVRTLRTGEHPIFFIDMWQR